MREDAERDPVEDALLQMGQLDERDIAIERAESEGVVAEVPELSSAKVDAIVAASLAASTPVSEIQAAPSPTSRSHGWVPWICAAAVAVAAALVLWQAPPSQVESTPTAASLPAAHQLRLGGTAQTLGGTPTVRSYGPGDAFFVELPFETPTQSRIVAELFALDPAGSVQPVPLSGQQLGHSVRFEGTIAEFLSPGIWTLRVRYGHPDDCSASTPDGCKTRETRIKVVGP